MIRSLVAGLAFCALALSSAFALDLPGPLVSTEWLAKHQEEVLVVDVRNDDKSFVEGGHLIGSVPLDFRKARETADDSGAQVADMSVPAEKLAALLSAAGVTPDKPTVLAHRGRTPDDAGYAAYVNWQMKRFGFDKVALLDGGVGKWVAESREVWGETDPVEAGNPVVATPRPGVAVTTADVEKAVKDKSADLVDARFFSFYVGLEKRLAVAKAGHIPGARLFPFDSVFDANGAFRPKEALAKAAQDVGLSPDKPVIAYCNTGHVSALTWFVLSEALGYRQAAVYDGSMLAWAAGERAVETRLP